VRGERQPQVPQALLAGLRLELGEHRQLLPGVAAALAGLPDGAVVVGLDRSDVLSDEGTHARGQVGGAGRGREVQAGDSTGSAQPATVATTRPRTAGSSHRCATRARRRAPKQTNGTASSTGTHQSSSRAVAAKSSPTIVVTVASRTE